MNISQLSILNTITQLRCRRVAPLLVPYADDRLRRAERERVEAHLENCSACRAEVKTIAGVSALLRDESLSLPPVADLSPNLWAGIEAEIRRSGAPLDRSAESPLLRPRRRVGLGWDAAWPSSVPVAAAVFSAIVFGTVLLNHHALTTPIAPAASGVAKGDNTVTIAMRSSASVPALAATYAAPGAPGAARSSADKSLSLARAEVAAPVAHRARAMVVSIHRSALMAVAGPLIADALHPNVARNSVAAKPAPTITLATVAPPRATFTSAPSAPRITDGTLADTNSDSAADRATTPFYNLGVSTPTLESARSAEVSGSDTDASAKTVGSVATITTASANTMSVAASKPADDDATVRSGAPADQPMADFAAVSRRQRSLFSYTSR